MIFFFSAIDDADLVDLAFGGEDLEHLLLLSKKHLYKVTGVVVHPKNPAQRVERKSRVLRYNRSAAVFGTFSQSD